MKELTLNDCSKRRLDKTYIVVYAIKNDINIKKAEYIEKCSIYTLIGIDINGYRQFLNIYQDRINNNRFWLDCFESLKSRGLKNILFLSVKAKASKCFSFAAITKSSIKIVLCWKL